MCDIINQIMITLPSEIDTRVSEVIRPFFQEIIALSGNNLHSIYLVGSAVTEDYLHNVSDINSLVLLHRIDFQFLQSLWTVGNRHRKRHVAAPLCITPDYVRDSLDVFPIEFFEFKLLHITAFGEDLLQRLEIKREHLRLQCEREIKSRLISLRQGYVSSLGDDKHLTALIKDSVNGSAPLLRAILYLLDQPVPLSKGEVFTALQDYMDQSDETLLKMLQIKQGKLKFKGAKLRQLFADFYGIIEKIGDLLNSL